MDKNLAIINPRIAGRVVVDQGKHHVCPGVTHHRSSAGKCRNWDGCLDTACRTLPLWYDHTDDWRVEDPEPSRDRPALKDILVTAAFNQETHRTLDWVFVET